MGHNNNNLLPVRILQWNCNSYTQREAHLHQISENYDIIILVETKLNDSSQISIPNFTTIRRDRLDTRGGGIIIAIKNDIPFSTLDTVLHIPSTLETLAATVNINGTEISIVAVYRPPRDPFPIHLWNRLIDSIPNRQATGIGGDSNCHNAAWGSNRTDNIADHLLTSFTDSGFLLLNDTSHTYINKANPENPFSNLDLTFISAQFYPLCS